MSFQTLIPNFDSIRPISEKTGAYSRPPAEIWAAKNVLNLQVRALIPRQKYIRDWILCWAWNLAESNGDVRISIRSL